ncbi:MAG: ATP-binding protein, partial [Bryobacteraceae bacterium]
ARAIRGEPVQNAELFTKTGPAQGRRISVNANPVTDEEGSIAGIVLVVRDISAQKGSERSNLPVDVTERLRAEQDLREANRALENVNEDLRHFAYAASHDLQEPLRIVRHYSELLSSRYRGKLDEDGEEFIRYMVEGVDRMEGLLEALREYWQVGMSSDQTPVSTDCNRAFKIAVAHLQSAIQQTNAVVSCDHLPVVMAHELPIVQLFQNLLSNAIKYRREDCTPEIQVTAKSTGREWLFAVSDNGMGIEPQYLQRIFGLFKRLHGGAFPGTGIGLTICSKVVERYGGKIWVESQIGKGSTFKFTLRAGDPAAIPGTESRPG